MVLQSEGQVLSEGRRTVTSHGVLEQLVDLDIYKLVLISNSLSIFLLSAAGSSHKDDTLGTRGALGVLELQDSVHDLLGDVLVRFVGVSYCDGALVDLFDSLDVQLVFCEGILCESKDLSLLSLRPQIISALFCVLDFALQIFDYFAVTSLKKYHLVRDDAHLKESQSLTLSSWETLDNVVGLVLLVASNDALKKLNDDLIFNIGVSLVGFSSLFTRLKTLIHLEKKLVTNIDALELCSPVELFNHSEGNVMGLTARWSNNHISLGFGLL